MTTSRAVLTVSGLAKSFTMHHLGRHLHAFDGLSFSVGEGEFVLLSGANGAGKSTLLRTIYRSYVANAGQINFHREDGSAIDLARAADIDIALLRRREIGFVTQFLVARPRVAAEDLVAEKLLNDGWQLDEARRAAREALAQFGVKPELWPAYPATFSGGEQQKVNLARAFILPPRLLLLDEPTASLDKGARAALLTRLAELKSAGTAMIGVFHHPGDVAALIDRELPLQTKELADVAL
ncbi:MAG: ATP-binding cassette domain-containing protein [Paracoccus sp. (in: a-proteobacteria)]|nr:ATP-binding cassette domain-containing protein [Paracoccus sp. (in: a-proteobacteria)]